MIVSRSSLDFRTAQATLSPMDTSTSRPHFLSIQEFGTIYGVGKTKVYALINAGVIDARKVGRRTMVTAESAQRWAASLPVKQPTRPGR